LIQPSLLNLSARPPPINPLFVNLLQLTALESVLAFEELGVGDVAEGGGSDGLAGEVGPDEERGRVVLEVC
jgi:hypothetical protein